MIPIEDILAEAESHCRRTGRPLVTLSYAQSLDGSLAAQRGYSLAISGPEAMKMTHQLRAAHDAILVGVGTVLADNPRLTVRLVQGRQPQPVILDSFLRISPEANIFRHQRPPWIAASELCDSEKQIALEATGARILRLPTDPTGRVDLVSLLEHLAIRGINTLMVEGGAMVIGSFLAQELVDQVVLTIAPLFVGGLHAIDREESLPEPFPRLREAECRRLGDDFIVWGRLA